MTQTTTQEPLIDVKVAAGVAVVLGVIGAFVLGRKAGTADFPDVAVGPLVAPAMTIVGMLLGAGLGLLLADVHKTTTVKEGLAAEGALPDPLEGLKLIKDLTPGKTLLVLGIVLFAVLLVAIDPPAAAAASGS
jgi:hypothetical protein